jgi:hypothetical protein
MDSPEGIRVKSYYFLLLYIISKERVKCTGVFTFCTATAFYPALLPSAREMRDIVKTGLTP